jgi:hypothetical protein
MPAKIILSTLNLAAGGSSDTKHIRGQADTFEDLKIGAPSALTTKEIKLPSTECLISLYLLPSKTSQSLVDSEVLWLRHKF